MTNYERMEAGLLYDSCDETIINEQQIYSKALKAFNELDSHDFDKKTQYMKEVFAECGNNNCIETPFHANWGGHHIHFGSGIYVNFNLTAVDDGHIYVGDNVIIGPNVTIITGCHPIDPELRVMRYHFNKDVHIGEAVWIGANVTIMPGVTIGKNSVIGAGSIVTKDVPDNVIVVGSPARVLREIGEHDREYFFKDERVDYDNLEEPLFLKYFS